MKIIYIMALLILSFTLTSCFTKPVVEEEVDTSVVEQEINEEISEDAGLDINTDETQTGSEDQVVEESAEQWEAGSWETDSNETSTDEQEIIESYEEDLEELFNDILGS